MRNAKYMGLMVAAVVAILLTASAVPASDEPTSGKEEYSLVPESSESTEGTPNEEAAIEDSEESEDDSLISKGRSKGAQGVGNNPKTDRTPVNPDLKRNANRFNNLQKSNFVQGGSEGRVTGIKTAPVRTGTASSGAGSKDLSKLSIGKQNTSSAPISLSNQSNPISLGDKSKLTPINLGTQSKPIGTSDKIAPNVGNSSTSPGSPLVKTAPPVSGLVGASALKPGILAGLDKIKPIGDRIKPIDPGKGNAQGGTTNTQGDVTGGGPGSVTTGGVQSGGGDGSNTQGSTVSTGGGNTVGGIQQSGNNNSVDITQNNTTNITNVKNVSGGGGGGGFVYAGSSMEAAPIESEPEPQPVYITRTVAAPQDSCPIVVELNQMGFNYYQTGTFNSAEEAFRRALEIIEKGACNDRPLKATTLENLAYTFDKLGKYDDAVKYQEQAQLIRRMQ